MLQIRDVLSCPSDVQYVAMHVCVCVCAYVCACVRACVCAMNITRFPGTTQDSEDQGQDVLIKGLSVTWRPGERGRGSSMASPDTPSSSCPPPPINTTTTSLSIYLNKGRWCVILGLILSIIYDDKNVYVM